MLDEKIILTFFGIIFICIGIIIIFHRFLLRKVYSLKTFGYIYAIQEELDIDNYKYYSIYVTYSIEGIEYKHKSTTGRYRNKFFLGQETLVYYNPKNPVLCYLKMDIRSDGMIAFFFIALGIFIVIFR